MLVNTLLGCATVMHGTSERVGIASLPRGAMVTVDDTYVGSTPVVVVMPRARSHTVRIACTGYETYTTLVRRHTSKSTWLNLAFIPYGVVGLVVDLADGGMYDLDTEQVVTLLLPNSASASIGERSCAADEHTAAPRASSGDPPHFAP